jgi:hypothetical protein
MGEDAFTAIFTPAAEITCTPVAYSLADWNRKYSAFYWE